MLPVFGSAPSPPTIRAIHSFVVKAGADSVLRLWRAASCSPCSVSTIKPIVAGGLGARLRSLGAQGRRCMVFSAKGSMASRVSRWDFSSPWNRKNSLAISPLHLDRPFAFTLAPAVCIAACSRPLLPARAPPNQPDGRAPHRKKVTTYSPFRVSTTRGPSPFYRALTIGRPQRVLHGPSRSYADLPSLRTAPALESPDSLPSRFSRCAGMSRHGCVHVVDAVLLWRAAYHNSELLIESS